MKAVFDGHANAFCENYEIINHRIEGLDDF